MKKGLSREPSLRVVHAMPEFSCDVCGASFALRFAYQQVANRRAKRHVCSEKCRDTLLAGSRPAKREVRRLAVMNHKGGTGKTTTAVNLAAGLADSGAEVLLVDADAQGHVAVSLGVRGPRSLYHVMVEGVPVQEAVVRVSSGLSVLSSDETLASAEVWLARMEHQRHQILRTRMASVTDYDYVVIDCGPSLSLLNMNALYFSGEVIIPVACDFLSLVGLRQAMKTIERVNSLLAHPVRVLGVLPTFYDQRNRISDESVERLRARFGDRVMSPIRVNTRLKEAPSFKQTIFDYAPQSRGATDYRRLVREVKRESSV